MVALGRDGLLAHGYMLGLDGEAASLRMTSSGFKRVLGRAPGSPARQTNAPLTLEPP
jgi:hypothetical protein